MINLDGIVAGYQQGSRILDNLTLCVRRGEIAALMGRNGMGKTTLLRVLTGHLPISKGSIEIAGTSILGLPPYEIANLGVGYVPQGREIFPNLTTEENLLLGVIGKRSLPTRVPEWAYQMFPVLLERRNQRADTMSGGQQQQLAIARALVGEPRLLLLDEPSEGIQPSIVREIADTLRRIAMEKSLTVLVVEQNLELVIGMATRFFFMENGRIVDEVSAEAISADSHLIHKYLSV
jgi:urea ABC transporter ATP-binding protein UrtE